MNSLSAGTARNQDADAATYLAAGRMVIKQETDAAAIAAPWVVVARCIA